MGTYLTLEIEGEPGLAARASEAAIRAVEHVEARLSTWRDDSELARLNAAPEESVAVSPELARDLAAALACAERTHGAFDPTVGTLVEAWGLRREAAVPPDATTLARARVATGWRQVRVHGDVVTRASGVRFEEGGFGKGVALDEAAQALREQGVVNAALDFGGQWLVIGRGREIALSPRSARVWLENASLATSGYSERGAHILDPRTGEIARDVGSMSVVAPTAALADCLSTGLFVLGSEAALAHDAAHDDIHVVVQARGSL